MINNYRELILYVDDEIENLDGFKYAFMADYDISVAQNAEEGLKFLEEKDIKVVISDQRMPKMSGIEFLKIAKEKSPNTVRIVLTAYADASNAIEAINKGEIYRYLSKPWDKADLKSTIDNAIESFNLKQENRELINTLKKTNQELQNQNYEYASLNEEYKTQNDELLKAKGISEESRRRFINLFEQNAVSLWEEDLSEVKRLIENKRGEVKDFKVYFDNNPDFVALCASKIIVKNVNKVSLDLFKVKSKKDLIKHLDKTFNEKSFETLKKLLLTIALNKTYFKEETEYNRSDGKVIYAIIQAVSTADYSKSIISITDISRQKHAEQKLQIQNKELQKAKETVEESQFRYKNIFINSLTTIYTFNTKKEFIDTNKAGVDLLGYSKEELLKLSMPDVDANTKKVLPAHGQLLSGDNLINFEHQLIRKDGKKITVLNNSISLKNKEGETIGMQSFLLDITDRKQAEKELVTAKLKAEESEKRYRVLSNASFEAIFISKNGYCTEANNTATKIFGYTHEESIGMFATDIFTDKSKGLIKTNLMNGYTEPYDVVALRKDGTTFDAEIQGVNFIYNNENLRITAIRDITIRKKTEKALIIAKQKAEESDLLKTEFINNMSHEIRTPMNGILGFSSMLNKKELSDEKQNNYINIIQNSGKQLMRIIDDILEISMLGTKQIKAIDNKVCLNDLLLEQFSIFDIKAKENNTPLYIKKGLSQEESVISTDETKLTKIISNLLENALKFTSTGFIELGYTLVKTHGRASQRANHASQLEMNRASQEIEIYVKDSGVGIDKEKQEIIFERFSQAEKELSEKVGGLGLGLSIAKENAELLGGSITLKSEKGKGTTFFIKIPYKPINLDTKKTISLKNNKTDIQGSKHNILIVEDDEVNYLYLDTLLENSKIDYKIIHAKNGKEAVEIFKNNREIEIILMDLKLPVMNGYEATRQIKKISPEIPIIAQTAYSTIQEKEQAFLAGCNDFISKPIDNEEFNKVIDKYLKK